RRLKRIRKLNVVCVYGTRERLDSRARINGFLQGLKNACAEFQLIRRDKPLNCDWKRDKARDEFARLSESKKLPIHLVIAANDEMALGVRDAILHSISDKYKKYVAS